jgi:hypothetical protein
MSLNRDEETKGVRAVLIVEVLGKPPEHLVETLKKIQEEIGNEKGVSILDTKIKEPVELKEQKGFYTCFSEIEVEVEEVLILARLMFKYMPAHVEVISPELIAVTNHGWGEILSELVRRLHGYDEVARVIQSEKKILENKLKEVLENQKKNPKKG